MTDDIPEKAWSDGPPTPGGASDAKPWLEPQLRAAVLAAVAPTAGDRDRMRQRLSMVLSRGVVPASVLRVDASMAARATEVAPFVARHGLVAKLLFVSIPVAVVAGLFWLRGADSTGSTGAPASVAEHTPTTDPAFVPSAAAPQPVARLARPADSVPSARPPAPLSERQKAPAVVTAIRVVEAASRPAARHPSRVARVAPQEPESSAAPVPDFVMLEPAVSAPPPPSPPRTPGAGLAAELKLLHSASDALAAHDPASALRLLATHAARYPQSPLQKEARGLRVMSLCAQGATPAARVERDAFLSSAAGSPLADRVQRACAALR